MALVFMSAASQLHVALPESLSMLKCLSPEKFEIISYLNSSFSAFYEILNASLLMVFPDNTFMFIFL
jgi:hypothetical protein